MTSGKSGFWPTYPHNQLSTSVSQLGINIAVISRILQQDVSHVFLWKLGQIGHPKIVLDSAHQGDYETPPTCLIWWSFGWDILGFRYLQIL